MDPKTGTSIIIDQRYLKIHYLINAKATEILRNQFASLWLEHSGDEWMNDESSGKKFISGVGKSFFGKTAQNLQKKSITSGNIQTWDLTLLSGAIKTIYEKPGSVQAETFITIEEMDKLKQIRNKLAHLGSTTIAEADFEKYWNTAVQIMERLGLSEDEIDAVNKLQCVNANKVEGNEASASEEESSNFKEIGNVAYREGDYVKAIDLYTSATNVEGISSATLGILYSNRSASFLSLGILDEAKEDAKRTVTLRPYWAKSYSRLAAVYEKEEKFWKALMQYRISLSIDPKYEVALDGVEYCKKEIATRNIDQHLDPQFLQASQMNLPGRDEELEGLLGIEDFVRKRMVLEGNPHFLCTEGHRFASGQGGYNQDYTLAARCYAKASAKGNAEGKYNLALLTAQGKGVRRDMLHYHQLLLEAAEMDPSMELMEGCGMITVRVGVMEAQHTLGLNYEQGIVVRADDKIAAWWYKRSIENGNGHSANNLGILHRDGRVVGRVNMQKAVLYWKLSSYRGVVLAMESLFYHYYSLRQMTLAQEWYDYAVTKGSIVLPTRLPYLQDNFKLSEGFDDKALTSRIKAELLQSELKDLIPLKPYMIGHPGYDIHSEVNMFIPTKPKGAIDDATMFINHHIQVWADIRQENRKQGWTTVHHTSDPTFKSIPPNIIGLQQITFKEFDNDSTEKVYKGFAIQLKAVTDVAKMNAISMVVMDENGNFGRVYIYNYPSVKTVQDEVGFGCSFTVINPYYKKMRDGMMGIRVEDPSCIMKLPHFKDTTLCRFCFKTGASLDCRKCRRVSYCSKKCCNDDLAVRSHQRVCMKKISL